MRASTVFLLLLALAASGAASAQPLLSLHSVRSPNSQSGGFFGAFIEALGDADGDGIGDFLVGVPDEVGGTGRAYAFSGADGKPIRTFEAPDGQRGTLFAVSIAAAGDANGDGTPDFLAGSRQTVGGLSNAGRATLISGATGAVLLTLVSPNPQADGLFSFAVAAPGDLNGDGAGDYVVGAPSEDIAVGGAVRVDHGAVYAFDGATGALLWTATPQTTEASTFFGRVASVGGDLNGDGVPDLIASAVDATSSVGARTGLAYALSGADGAVLYTMESGNARNNAGGGFGWSLAGLSDLDGDGVRDLGVGAPFEGVGGTSARDGTVSFFSGATGARLGTYAEEERQAERLFGWQVKEVGDFNGDGVTEIGISAPRQFNAFEFRPSPFTEPVSGALFITSGADVGRGVASEDLAEIYPTLPDFPTQFRWQFGRDFARIGDVDGDGLPDLAIGAPFQGNNIGFVGVFPGARILAIADVDVDAEDTQPVAGDGTYRFASTGVSFAFRGAPTARRAQGAAAPVVTVERHRNPPADAQGIAEVNVAGYRWVTHADREEFTVDAESEIRFALADIPGSSVTDPAGVVVYQRLSFGTGAFAALDTRFDAATGEVVARVTSLGEFTFASDSNALPTDEPVAGSLAVTASPNPARGEARLTVSLAAPGPARVTVYDALGRRVALVHDGPLAAGVTTLALDTARLPAGVYVVRAEAGGQTVTRTVTVVR